jgi:hypothetical protein
MKIRPTVNAFHVIGINTPYAAYGTDNICVKPFDFTYANGSQGTFSTSHTA